ncbi:Hint domain-containing protein [Roseobacter sp. YSTF-M11]|uniref:Hint domain-containing protein n=1 Tax=Roseobacter insulae TaxID=2859783 RepID=A0A9X1FZT0_9RHOB|nr:Hint domain-containing protein [Roseobacter insulae]MBW4710632.1 Hint domain-containing protein [Roseobacter insulae]
MTNTPPASATPPAAPQSYAKVQTASGARGKPSVGVRVVDIAALRSDGSIVIGQRKVPTMPQFDMAFSAFAHGTLLQTTSGLIAVEDLQPGDDLMTAEGKASKVTWIGSATFAPSDGGHRTPLTRIMADSFGVNRPDSFLSLGPAARLLQTPPHLRGDGAEKRVLTPARAFVEGVNVIEVSPPTPIRMFHLSLQSHAAVIAGGLEIETYHPGPNALRSLSHTLRDVYLSLFPHVSHVNEFGPMRYARATDEFDLTAA